MANEAEWKECFDLFDKAHSAHSAHCTGLKQSADVATGTCSIFRVWSCRGHTRTCSAGFRWQDQGHLAKSVICAWLAESHGSRINPEDIQKIFRRYSEVQQSKTEMQKQRMIGGWICLLIRSKIWFLFDWPDVLACSTANVFRKFSAYWVIFACSLTSRLLSWVKHWDPWALSSHRRSYRTWRCHGRHDPCRDPWPARYAQAEVGGDLISWEKFKGLVAKKPKAPEKQAASEVDWVDGEN